MNNLKRFLSYTGIVIFVTIFPCCRDVRLERDLPGAGILEAFVNEFNANDTESVVNHIPNAVTAEWMGKNVPLFECPDMDIEKAYYFRWWTYRKHIKNTPDGFVITEFLPQVSWSKKHNTINCPAGHHFYEGRWIHNNTYLDDYARFYFGKGGDPGGVTKVYSNWITDGIYARFLVNGDRDFVTGLLDSLISNHDNWRKDRAGGNDWQKSRKLSNGLYWQIDSWEGGEFSIGGNGIRPMINSYIYSGAMAVGNIAALAGRKETAKKYFDEAAELRKLVQENLWDPNDCFFKTLRHKDVRTDQYMNDAAELCEPGRLVRVKELFGYVPWYFNLPEAGKGYEKAWRYLTDSSYFAAPAGPTVPERNHPNFYVNNSGCMWCGASWPFTTSMTLSAMANLLNNYDQDFVDRNDYYKLLRTYAKSHSKGRADGSIVSWIDESLNPFTGEWIPTEGTPPRGKDYNHSTFCDLVITGLAGIRPRADNILEISPLIPSDNWEYFCLGNVLYHGKLITIVWDRTGEKYGIGKGLRVYLDGYEIGKRRDIGCLKIII